MIWTTTSSVVAGQVIPPDGARTDTGPRLGELITAHGMVGGLKRGIQLWRHHPPHGPIALSSAPTDTADLPRI
jgi:hypothetical protein